MAITYTNSQTQEKTVRHAGQVLEIKTFIATRNMSDTLDYTDFRTVECTEALVYNGRTVKEFRFKEFADGNEYVDRPALVHELFSWVDCSNHFAWRGSDIGDPEVDGFPFGVVHNPHMLEDYEAWKAFNESEAQAFAKKRAAQELAEQKRKEQEEKDRPVKGKKMIVFKGRKVPVGYTGTVAFISATGNVLLKKDDEWQDRKADGTWVMGHHLKAV